MNKNNKGNKNNVIIKLPMKGEMDFQSWCNHECKRINGLLTIIEQEFQTDMNEHQELRSYILDTSNHIKRLLTYIEDIEDERSEE